MFVVIVDGQNPFLMTNTIENLVVCPAIIIMIWAIVKSVITTELGKYDLGLDQMSEVI